MPRRQQPFKLWDMERCGKKGSKKNDWQEEKGRDAEEIHPNTSLTSVARGVICIAIPTSSSRRSTSQNR